MVDESSKSGNINFNGVFCRDVPNWVVYTNCTECRWVDVKMKKIRYLLFGALISGIIAIDTFLAESVFCMVWAVLAMILFIIGASENEFSDTSVID